MPEQPLIDEKRLQAICDGDTEGLHYLLGIFCEQTKEDLKNLEIAIHSGINDEIRRLSHGAAGACETYGIPALSIPLRAIESEIIKGQSSNALHYYAQANVIFHRTETALAHYQSTLSQRKAA